jgi:curved DNA-binding protein CbpA
MIQTRVHSFQHPRPTEMPRHNHYSILGVARNASNQELKQAWAAKILETHPDKTLTNTATAFRAVQRAYEVLRHDNTRAEYDALLNAARSREAFVSDVDEDGEECVPFKPPYPPTKQTYTTVGRAWGTLPNPQVWTHRGRPTAEFFGSLEANRLENETPRPTDEDRAYQDACFEHFMRQEDFKAWYAGTKQARSAAAPATAQAAESARESTPAPTPGPTPAPAPEPNRRSARSPRGPPPVPTPTTAPRWEGRKAANARASAPSSSSSPAPSAQTGEPAGSGKDVKKRLVSRKSSTWKQDGSSSATLTSRGQIS